ncbi:hypothetical protein COOONC_02039 [Cooperia oncophora]
MDRQQRWKSWIIIHSNQRGVGKRPRSQGFTYCGPLLRNCILFEIETSALQQMPHLIGMRPFYSIGALFVNPVVYVVQYVSRIARSLCHV